MLHMIEDQLEAYRIAVETRAKTEVNYYTKTTDMAELRACREEENLRLDGLRSVIGMAIREYAAREPCNPFSINGDVNQGVIASIEDALSDDPQPDWRDSLSDAADALRPPPPIANGPPPREDI